ncbi:hypothetical protein A1O1_06309 [Capronia coronata CBS 617.96]|uniref:Zn(2)-C6 fungal-type domain-containing protein n=1 Tax=Capronia coronata CBS 617.96 TaxID=1182541 RepID=W9Y8J1_9EURO|nr:uncharacterized protein A1O1_06309 [Capronia coronata CBS 617.96]EXJ85940.1 hypothetical protein A1O1_06309 [Capronia coronata CBS 617.96]
MVFTGKPSRACAHCRRRKLRCDLRKQACGQCVRAGLTCSGYRDPNQLRIRDESNLTRQKVLESRRIIRLNVQTIDLSIEELARATFCSHYVNGLAKTYDVLQSIGKQSPLDKHLAASLDAASLAFFYFRHYSTDAARRAQEKYLSALPLVNKALGSADLVARDSTLLAVLLLDLFEKIMNNNPRSSDSWMSHVNGALALLKVRDVHQFQSYVGLRLSVRLFTNMLISCVAANAPIPPALDKLRQKLDPLLDPLDPKWRVSGLVMDYSNFRGALQTGCLAPSDVVLQAKILDDKFRVLAERLPPSWIRHSVPGSKQSDRVFEQYYDVYPDYFTAQTRNVIRMMRILLHDTIRSAYTELATSDDYPCLDQHIRSSVEMIDSLAQEICAPGPQFTAVENVRDKIDDFSSVRKMHYYTLLFPFYVAGLFASPESGITEWVVSRLRSMASTSGIKNARLVADILTASEKPAPWTIYAVLGSYAFAA